MAGVAYCDITTGEFAATQIDGKHPEDVEQRVGEELSRLQPSELIHVDWDPAHSDLRGLLLVLDPLYSQVDGVADRADTADEALRCHFKVTSLDGFGLQGKEEAVRGRGRGRISG
ncbi:MAG: hypothetical protein R2851_29045 [Caldilineaceae bacterium]